MPDKNKALQRQTGGLRKRDDSRLKYNDFPRHSKSIDLDAYERAVRRACIDAYVLLKDFPSRLRFSYYIDRNGRLRCQAERMAGI